ncbi:MAG: hypothetical protein HQL32_15335, partial [Planctomycetes bacterium]|nr:hypothetical protein [Planctomycetota bacterium]
MNWFTIQVQALKLAKINRFKACLALATLLCIGEIIAATHNSFESAILKTRNYLHNWHTQNIDSLPYSFGSWYELRRGGSWDNVTEKSIIASS